MLKAIIFDFDGVLVESVDIKTKAFARLFCEYDEYIIDKIIAYHIKNGGVSRYEKFKYIFKYILYKQLSDTKLQMLGKEFSDIIIYNIIHASFVKGAEDFLEKYHKELDIYVASGTPEEELHTIIKKREMSIYFKGIYGSPRTKSDIIKDILEKNKYLKKELVVIGDSIQDYYGAVDNDIKFIGRITRDMKSPFTNCKTINDLSELENALFRT